MTTDPREVKTIYVDLDHTLLGIDLLRDRLSHALFHQPLDLARGISWLLQGGPARLKWEWAKRHSITAADLPYNSELLAFLQARKKAGQRLVLATAAPQAWADEVSRHLGLFDAVLATGPDTGNFKGRRKLEGISRDAGGEPFGYAGDAWADRPIFEAARLPIVVGATAELAGGHRALAVVLPRTVAGGRPWWQALRIHQWSKNLLLVAPAIGAHRLLAVGPQLLLGFGAFCCTASALYLFNDLSDVDADRRHVHKRGRALACGTLDPVAALALMVALLGLAAIFALPLPGKFALVLICYAVTNMLYSKQFKQVAVLDVTVLGFLYSVRVFAGGAACGIAVSTWLAALTFFLAMSLAHLKRFVETKPLAPGTAAPARPAYAGEDILWLAIGGIGSGLVSVLVLALYITSPQVYSIYHKPQLLYIICVLQFYWIERMWMLAHRGRMLSDPIAFMLKDRSFYALTALVLAVIYVAAL